MKKLCGKAAPQKSRHILIFAWACALELGRGSKNSLQYSYNYDFGCSRLVENMIGNYPVDFNNGESANIRNTQSGKERP